jgi:hypothetical protein
MEMPRYEERYTGKLPIGVVLDAYTILLIKVLLFLFTSRKYLEGAVVKVCSFITSTPDGDEWSDTLPGRSTPIDRTRGINCDENSQLF